MDKTIYIRDYNIDICGDGKYEYEGYFMIIICEFDDNDKPTGKRKRLYIKTGIDDTQSFKIIEQFLNEKVEEVFYNYRDNEKLFLFKEIKTMKI